MVIESEWNEHSPEPQTQDEIRIAITRLEKEIADSPTDPRVAKGIQEQLVILKKKLRS